MPFRTRDTLFVILVSVLLIFLISVIYVQLGTGEFLGGVTMEQWLAIITTATTVILAIYAGVQIWLMRKDIQESRLNRSATVLLSVVEKMNELRDKRHQLYSFPPDHRKWNEKQKKLADEVGVSLQQVAYLVEMRLIDKRYIFENYAKVFEDSWQKLGGFIDDYRRVTGDQSQRKHLEQLAKKCMEYRRKHVLAS